jgi:hypothetical protein
MPKIGERVSIDDQLMVINETWDFTPELKRARMLRDAGKQSFGESKLVAEFPAKLYYMWAKEAGLDPSDHEAMAEVAARKLQSGEYAHFRVWEGTF